MVKKFKYTYSMGYIDYYDNAISVGEHENEFERVVRSMPEEMRGEGIWKTFIPNFNENGMTPIYFTKANNNGTMYIFSDTELCMFDKQMEG